MDVVNVRLRLTGQVDEESRNEVREALLSVPHVVAVTISTSPLCTALVALDAKSARTRPVHRLTRAVRNAGYQCCLDENQPARTTSEMSLNANEETFESVERGTEESHCGQSTNSSTSASTGASGEVKENRPHPSFSAQWGNHTCCLIQLTGIHCIFTSFALEHRLKSVDGVRDVCINFFTSRARVVLENCTDQPSVALDRRGTLDRSSFSTRSFLPRPDSNCDLYAQHGGGGGASTRKLPSRAAAEGRSSSSNCLDDAFALGDDEMNQCDLEDLVLEGSEGGLRKTLSSLLTPQSGEARRRQDVISACMEAITNFGGEGLLLTPLCDQNEQHRGHAPLQEVAENMERSNYRDMATSMFCSLYAFGLSIPICALNYRLQWIQHRQILSETATNTSGSEVVWEEWTMFILATIAHVLCGRSFFQSAWKIFRYSLLVGSDMLITLATSATYLYSVTVLILRVSGNNTLTRMNFPCAFDTGVLILFISCMMRFIIAYTRKRVNRPFRQLLMLQPGCAWRVEAPQNEVEDWLQHQAESDFHSHDALEHLPKKQVSINEIKVGDYIIVPPGEPIPTDTVLKYHSHANGADMDDVRIPGEDSIAGGGSAVYVDESALNGDPFPVPKFIGDSLAGSFTLNQVPYTLLVQATAVGECTVLSHVARLIEEAPPYNGSKRRIANGIAHGFGPAALILGVASFVLWTFLMTPDGAGLSSTFFTSFMTAVSVLVIACPCTFLIVSPSFTMVGTSVAAENGILLRSGLRTLENMCKIDTLVFDKDAISEGNPTFKQFIPFLTPSFQQDGLLRGYPRGIGDMKNVPLWVAACAELQSSMEEPGSVGQAIIQAAREFWAGDDEDITCIKEGVQVSDVRTVGGEGVECVVEKDGWGKRCIRVGSKEWVSEDIGQPTSSSPDHAGLDYNRSTSPISDLDIVELEGRVEMLEKMGQSVVYISAVSACHVDQTCHKSDGSPAKRCIIGVIGLMDPVQPQAPNLVLALHKLGIEVWMCTGDHSVTAASAANEANIPQSFVCSGFKAEEQADLIHRLAKRGYYRTQKKNQHAKEREGAVAYVGTSFSDPSAVSNADVGIVIGNGAEVPEEAGHVFLIRQSLEDVVVGLHFSKRFLRFCQWITTFALAYCVLAPFVAAGILYPWTKWIPSPFVAASLMAVSNIAVTVSSVGLSFYTPPILNNDGELEETWWESLQENFQDWIVKLVPYRKVEIAEELAGDEENDESLVFDEEGGGSTFLSPPPEARFT